MYAKARITCSVLVAFKTLHPSFISTNRKVQKAFNHVQCINLSAAVVAKVHETITDVVGSVLSSRFSGKVVTKTIQGDLRAK